MEWNHEGNDFKGLEKIHGHFNFGDGEAKGDGGRGLKFEARG